MTIEKILSGLPDEKYQKAIRDSYELGLLAGKNSFALCEHEIMEIDAIKVITQTSILMNGDMKDINEIYFKIEESIKSKLSKRTLFERLFNKI